MDDDDDNNLANRLFLLIASFKINLRISCVWTETIDLYVDIITRSVSKLERGNDSDFVWNGFCVVFLKLNHRWCAFNLYFGEFAKNQN